MIFSSLTASFNSLFLGVTGLFAASDDAAAGGVFLFTCGFICCVFLVLVVPSLAGMYKMFEKAGQPGWQAFVPFLGGAVMAHIVGRDWWWGIVPILNYVVVFELAKAFGKSDAFGIGCLFLGPIFIPILGFGSAQYVLPQRPPLV